MIDIKCSWNILFIITVVVKQGRPPSSAKEAGSGAVVPGFPNGGLATTVQDGHGFTWGDLPVIAAGRTYDLCWCNGTASNCLLLAPQNLAPIFEWRTLRDFSWVISGIVS